LRGVFRAGHLTIGLGLRALVVNSMDDHPA
jgi:hypothetical protein